MKHLSAAAFTALIASPVIFAGSAFAGSMAEPAVAPAPVPVVAAPTFSGGNWDGGYAGAQLGWGWMDADPKSGQKGSGDDVMGGVHAGYLMSSGQFVYGAEVDYDWADIELDNDVGKVNGIGRIKAIAGYDMGRTLVYATAGGAYADTDLNGRGRDDWGWVAGGGVKYLVSENVAVGGEVLYQQFDDIDGSGYDLDGTTVSARVSYQF
ncbi:outer membrane protein [Pseudoruegeria sp. SK021]|uniref:outer membrane protein n=1 Tax=Pseudoruegeria sp. SK021 TaxID=1933035 RepID=UPI000A22422F|nr:outer membrane beta-barrel protein [Pseudoruegeria sp. SK021]OSP56761.1 hypothetical protein BV911_02110 [Pseudoruegeria sp. SK021]